MKRLVDIICWVFVLLQICREHDLGLLFMYIVVLEKKMRYNFDCHNWQIVAFWLEHIHRRQYLWL